jgi:molecular chaperone DnaK (HSP70)
MPYVLGVDVGTSRTRAAVCRHTAAGWSDPVPVPLGARHPGVPTVVYLGADRSALVGDEAERHASTDPVRVGRGFLGRVGDDVPLVLGGVHCTGHELTAVLIRWTVDRVAEHEGGAADAVVVTHPGGWGPHRTSSLRHELARQELPDVTLLAAPVALAEGCPARGDVLATYRLGAGGAEAAVLRRGRTGAFELVAHADGTEAVGGGHFDDAIVDCVRDQVGRALDDLDPADPDAWLAMARLRGVCTGAKELLSTEAEVMVPVRLPAAPADIRVTRADFERVIRPAVTAGAGLLPRLVRTTGLPPAAVVLAGGSVRVPLVAELLRAAAAAPVVVAADPEASVAAGAATAARRFVTGPDPERVPRGARDTTELIERSAIAEYAGEQALDPADVAVRFGADPPSRPPVGLLPIELPAPRLVPRLLSSIRPAALTASTIALAAVGIVLTFMLESGHPSPANPLHLGPTQPTTTRATSAPPGATH